ncbi:MAG: cutinase [Mycobacterium sp.]|nr:cutinase [Mycobacterium sp.]
MALLGQHRRGIVAGVSMGGIKWGSALPPEYANNVTSVATFGDVADRAGGSLPTQSALFGSKAIDVCNPNDPICHAGPGNEWSGHTEGYIPVYSTQAAAFVASELLAGSGQKVPGYDPPQGFGPQPGYGPQAPGYDPQLGYGPQAPGYGPPQGYGPQPGYGPQAPGYDPSINGTASPSPKLGLVSAVH